MRVTRLDDDDDLPLLGVHNDDDGNDGGHHNARYGWMDGYHYGGEWYVYYSRIVPPPLEGEV